MAADLNAALDELSLWESKAIAEGHRDGIQLGKQLGFEEGQSLGEVKGAEIGSEIGFYYGCFLVWHEMIQSDQWKHKLNQRAIKSILSLGTLLEAFELKNIVDEDLYQKLLRIRAKFKVATAQLSDQLQTPLVFNPENVEAHKNMSF